MADEPILAYDNVIQAAPYVFLSGVDSDSRPLSNATTRDMLRIASPTLDSTGKMVVEYATQAVADTLILGAHRNSSGGYRFGGGSVQVEAREA